MFRRDSQVGAITPDQRKQIIESSVLAGHYEKAVDRESAYEKLQARAAEKAQTAGAPPVAPGPLTLEGEKPSVLASELSAPPQRHSSPQSGRAVDATIRWRLQW